MNYKCRDVTTITIMRILSNKVRIHHCTYNTNEKRLAVIGCRPNSLTESHSRTIKKIDMFYNKLEYSCTIHFHNDVLKSNEYSS